jgi:hypothetical protein
MINLAKSLIVVGLGDMQMEHQEGVVKWVHPIDMSIEECHSIADRVPCGRHYFLLAAKYGVRRFSPEKCMRIEQVTGGRIQKWMLRPDIWAPPPDYVFPSQRRYRKRIKIDIVKE